MSARESRPVWETGGDQPTTGSPFPGLLRAAFFRKKRLDKRAPIVDNARG